MTSSKPNYLPKAHLQILSHCGLGLHHMNLVGVGGSQLSPQLQVQCHQRSVLPRLGDDLPVSEEPRTQFLAFDTLLGYGTPKDPCYYLTRNLLLHQLLTSKFQFLCHQHTYRSPTHTLPLGLCLIYLQSYLSVVLRADMAVRHACTYLVNKPSESGIYHPIYLLPIS